MTISSTANKAILYGNGVATSWPYKFMIPKASQLSVIVTDLNGNQTQLSPTQFAVSGLGSKNGGTVTYPLSGTPLALGWSITILRSLQIVQQTDIVNQSGFYPDVLESAMDYQTMTQQQLAEQQTRSIAFPVVDDQTAINAVLPAAAARATRPLIFDATGNVVTGQQAYQEPQTLLDSAKSTAEGLVAGVAGGYGYYQQNGFATAIRTFQDKMRESASVGDFIAGGPDDTVQLWNAMSWLLAATARRLNFAKKIYRISSQTLINALQDAVIDGNGAIIQAAPGMAVASGSQLLMFTNCQRVTVRNLYVDGNRSARTPAEVAAHSIQIYTGCSQLTFDNVHSDNAVCDGWYIGSATPNVLSSIPTDIKLIHCTADNAYRNGMSVINSVRLRDYFGKFTNTTGTAPQAGIDFEPNNAVGGDLGNIDIRCYGTVANGNAGPGFQVTQANTEARLFGVRASSNGAAGVSGAWGYLEIDGIELDSYGAGITRGVIDCSSGSGETHIRGVKAHAITTGSDIKPLIFVHGSNTGPVSIESVTASGVNCALVNAYARSTISGLNHEGATGGYTFLLQGNAAKSVVRGVAVNGVNAVGYVSVPNVSVDGVTAINPTISAGSVLWFDTGATYGVLKNAHVTQDTAIPTGQNAFRFSAAPRHIDNVSAVCSGGTDYTASNACVFAAGVAGSFIGHISPYPLTMPKAITPSAMAAGTALSFGPYSMSGALMGDQVIATYDQDLQNCGLQAWVSSSGAVKAILVNNTSGSVTLAPGNLTFRLQKRI